MPVDRLKRTRDSYLNEDTLTNWQCVGCQAPMTCDRQGFLHATCDCQQGFREVIQMQARA